MKVTTESVRHCLDHPHKLQIVQLVQDRGQCTARELQELIPDLPQATLYWMLKNLVDQGLLEICQEIKVRAVLQKVYQISQEWIQLQNTMLQENDAETYYKMFQSFVMKLSGEFDAYARRDHVDIARDGSGFSAVTLYASTEELQEIGAKINDIVREYLQPKEDTNQKPHIFATILTPPQET